VAATDPSDVLANFSNYGATSVDVGAPGTSIYSSVLARNTVFLDDMEAGDANWAHDATDPLLDTWAVDNTGDPSYGPPFSNSGAWSFTDSPYNIVDDEWAYENNTDSWLGSFNNFNLVDQFGTKLIFWVRTDLDVPATGIPTDFLWIEGSSQHGPWFNYGGLWGSTNQTFQQVDLDFSHHDNLPDLVFRFHLTTDSSGQDDGVYIDDVILKTRDLMITGYGYFPFAGTSMAAPHVAGTIALMLSKNPSFTQAYYLGDGPTLVNYIRSILHDTAKDIGARKLDSNSGYGLVQAGEACTQF